MATVRSTVVDATPAFVAGSFGAQDIRLATMSNELPGLFESGHFASTQRAAGANMSVDLATGAALLSPGSATLQGSYVGYNETAGYNTSSTGGMTWPAADGANPRIDLLCLEVRDTAEDGSGSTGFGLRLETGTANAGATHQNFTAYWPTVPTGCVPIAAVRMPAAATTITTANITNLNPVAGGRSAYSYAATADTTASTTYTRLTTHDGVFVYVPHANARVRVFMESHWKISAASGTQGVTLFLNDTQVKVRNATNGAPVVGGYEQTSIGTFYSRLTTSVYDSGGATIQLFFSVAGATADVTDVTTGVAGYSAAAGEPPGGVEISQLAAGWYLIEPRYKTSANTLSVRERRVWAEVVA